MFLATIFCNVTNALAKGTPCVVFGNRDCLGSGYIAHRRHRRHRQTLPNTISYLNFTASQSLKSSSRFILGFTYSLEEGAILLLEHTKRHLPFWWEELTDPENNQASLEFLNGECSDIRAVALPETPTQSRNAVPCTFH